MRWILLGLLGAACLLDGVAQAQEADEVTPTPEELRKIYQELAEAGSVLGSFGRKEDRWNSAVVHMSSPNALTTFERLRDIKGLVRIEVRDLKSENVHDLLKKLTALPNIKMLDFKVDKLTEDQVKSISAVKQLEDLRIYVPIADENIRDFHALKSLKNLKRLELGNFKTSPTALEELKTALAHVKDSHFVKPFPALQPIEIFANDDPLMKLRKAKLNAAFAEFQDKMALGVGFSDYIQAASRIKQAALELNDSTLTMSALDQHAIMLERVYLNARCYWMRGDIRAHEYHHVHYHYLDAQIVHLQLKKKLESK